PFVRGGEARALGGASLDRFVDGGRRRYLAALREVGRTADHEQKSGDVFHDLVPFAPITRGRHARFRVPLRASPFGKPFRGRVGRCKERAMTTAARLAAFLEMMSAERGASDNTLAAYARDLDDAAAFLGGRLAEAGADDIRAFLDDVAARG